MADKFKGVSVSLANLPLDEHAHKHEHEQNQNEIIEELSEDNEDQNVTSEERVENIRDDMWWTYLRKDPQDGVSVLPPHIDKSYQEFNSILKDTNVRKSIIHSILDSIYINKDRKPCEHLQE